MKVEILSENDLRVIRKTRVRYNLIHGKTKCGVSILGLGSLRLIEHRDKMGCIS